MAARRATPPPPKLTPRNCLAVDYIVHCQTAHRSHLPGAAGCAICLAARRATPVGLDVEVFRTYV